MNPNDLALPQVRVLSPYLPGKPISELQRELGLTRIIKLASNENPLGPSPKALEAVRDALPELHLYPDGNGFDLKTGLAASLGVDTAQITLGNGSNDVLEIIARTFLAEGQEAIFSEYAFAVYGIVTQATGARAKIAKAHDGSRGPCYGHDLDAMSRELTGNTRVVFIANPNNPTGTYVDGASLHSFLKKLPAHVVAVLDEAYVEYISRDDYPDCIKWLDEFPNLIVTRTFSKAYGLAGLRVGYAVSGTALAGLLNRVRQPFNVNSLALIAATAALEDQYHLHRSVYLNRDGLLQLESSLKERNLDYIPSVGNFISIDFKRPAAPIYEALLREGIIVRPIANYGMPNHLRVTIGTFEEINSFIKALDKVLAAA